MPLDEGKGLFSWLPDVESCTAAGLQFQAAGISTLADVLELPIAHYFQSAITEKYRSCKLNRAACNQLIKRLMDNGIEVTVDFGIGPDLSLVPKVFSELALDNEDIIPTFYEALNAQGRVPSIEEIACGAALPTDSIRNSGVEKLILEHQQVLNYVQWLLSTRLFDLPKHYEADCKENRSIDAGMFFQKYPYNLLRDVVPGIERMRCNRDGSSEILSKLAQMLDCLVYLDLSLEERNVIALCYKNSNHGTKYFSETTLQWGLEFWCYSKKREVVHKLREISRYNIYLTERDLLTSEELLEITVEELDLSVRAFNCLKRTNINTVGDLISKTEDEMLKVRNLGSKALEEVRTKLDSLGLHFRSGCIAVAEEVN